MNILILNGSAKDNRFAELVCNTLSKILTVNPNEVTIVALAEVNIASCLGCFGCWLKTPGMCVIPDAGQHLAKSIIQSNLLITISPITFGGYCYHLKKVFDRLIPIISPLFMKINGEVHHKPRYDHYPANISIGLLPERNEEKTALFQQLAARNALNMHSSAHLSKCLCHSQSALEVDLEMTALLQKAGALT